MKIASTSLPTTAEVQTPPSNQQQNFGLGPQLIRPDKLGHDELLVEMRNAVAAGDQGRVFVLASKLVTAGTQQCDEDKLNSVPTLIQKSPVQAGAVEPTARTAIGAEDKWLTLTEARKAASVCGMTMWRWRNDRGLKSVKIGGVVRIRAADLRKFIEGHFES